MKRVEDRDRYWYFGALWQAFVVEINAFADILGLLYRLVGSPRYHIANYRLMHKEFARQVYRIGARGWPAITITAILLGLAIIVYVSEELQKIEAGEFVGYLLVVIVVRELGPVLTALLVLLRSGAAMTVEIGAMIIDREIEALELMGVEPEIFIGVPRFWGFIISLIILYGIFLTSAIFGGYLFGQVLADIYWQELWLSFLKALRWQDMIISGVKIVLFGMSMASVAIYYGLKSEERLGSLSIQATAGAVTSLYCIGILNAILTSWVYISSR